MNKQSVEATCYTALCSEFKLKPEWLGKTVVDDGKKYTISGLNLRSKRFPVTTKEGTSFNADYLRALITGTMTAYEKKRATAYEKKRNKLLKQARKDFASDHTLFDIPNTWLDESFVDGRTKFRIVGLQPSSKYPLVCQREDGKVRSYNVDYVRELMGKK